MKHDVSPKILIVRLNSLGDVVLSTSVPLALRSVVPDAHITFLTRDTFACVLDNNPGVDRTAILSRGGSALGDLMSTVTELRASRFDLILDLQCNPRSRLLCMLARPRGCERAQGDALARHGMVRLKGFGPRRVRHCVERFLKAIEKAFGPVPAMRPRIFLSKQESDFAWRFVRSSRARVGGPVIGVCPGARWETKKWGTDKMSLLAQELHAEGAEVLVLGGRPDRAAVKEMEMLIGNIEGVRSHSGDLRSLAAVMSQCDCVVSNDSGLMHIAHAVGTPVVAVFGSTVPEFGFFPPDSRSTVISKSFDCKPCDVHGRDDCKKGDMRCMNLVSVSQVRDEVNRVLSERRRAGTQAKERLELPRFVLSDGESSVSVRGWSLPASGSVAVRVPNWVGDAVMAQPSLAGLRGCAEGRKLVAVAHERVAGLFEDGRIADELVRFQSRGMMGLIRASVGFRNKHCDAGILMPDSFSSALMLRLGGVKRLVGFRGELRDPMLAVRLRRDRWSHLCEQYSQLLPLECEAIENPGVAVSPAELGKAWDMLKEVGVQQASAPVLLAPGASYGETKRWPEERYLRLTELLVERLGLQVVLVGNAAERELCERIAEKSAPSVTNLSGRTTLRQFGALACLAALFVGNDSGAAHLAAAAGCPAVVIFGSSDPTWTAPRGRAVRVLYEKVSCSPCFRKSCPYDLECLAQISVDKVYDAAAEVYRLVRGERRKRESGHPSGNGQT